MRKVFNNRDMYILISTILLISKELFISSYTFSSFGILVPNMLVVISYLFAFSTMMYWALAVCHYVKKMRNGRTVLGIVLNIGITLIWLYLCQMMNTSSLLINVRSSFWGVLPCIYSICYLFTNERKERSK